MLPVGRGCLLGAFLPGICSLCKQPAMSMWRKTQMGPARAVKCQACGGEISVSGIHSLVSLAPFFAAVVFAFAGSGSLALKVALCVAGFVVLTSLSRFWVPPVPR